MVPIISTAAANILTFIVQSMPNLRKNILEQSTLPLPPKKEALLPTLPIVFLVPTQIIEAREHPTNYVKEAIATVAVIQGTLNDTTKQLDMILEQKKSVEIAIIAINEQLAKQAADKSHGAAKPGEHTPDKMSKEQLTKELANLQKSEKELRDLIKEIKKKFDEVDKMLLQHAEAWMKHVEDFIKDLVKELKDSGIALTDEELLELRSGAKTISEIRNKIKNLRKLLIDIDESAADYVVRTYDAVVTGMSRLLQKIDNKSVKGVVNNLSVLGKEKSDVKKIITEQAKQYNAITESTKKLKTEIEKHPGLTAQQIQAVAADVAIITKTATKEAAPELVVAPE